MVTDIVATRERQNELDMFGVKYKVDEELCFVFESKNDLEKAKRIFKSALID